MSRPTFVLVGAGLAGAKAAETLRAEGFDGRASAISTASWNLFTNIGLADKLEPPACPIASRLRCRRRNRKAPPR